MNKEHKKALLNIARKAIEHKLGIINYSLERVNEDILNSKSGVFVTLNKNGALRGCIGYIVGIKPLYQAVYDMAIQAAFYDPRFLPIDREELKYIEIEISVLSPLKKINSIEEIKIGKHGLFIKNNNHSGLLLPQVAVEWNYNVIQFLNQTCLKAGMYKGCYKDSNTEIFIFEAEIFSEGDFNE